jgi:hypothetical protein
MTENFLPFHENCRGSPGFPIAIGDTENDISSGVIPSPIKVSFIESDLFGLNISISALPKW